MLDNISNKYRAVHHLAKFAGHVVASTDGDVFQVESLCQRVHYRLVIEGGKVYVKGVPQKSVTLGELARLSNPLRGAVKPGSEPGLEATDYFGPEGGSTASGVHAMIVEVDPQTMMLEIKKYVTVHDCGRVINPMILEGQIQGGVAQGIGNAFYEQLNYDESGQLTNASFMDYLLPTANDVPNIEAE